MSAKRVFSVVLPDIDKSLAEDGYRLHVHYDPDEGRLVDITRERVLPEQVANPDANHVAEVRGPGWLCMDEARWLRDQLTRVLLRMEEYGDG